MLRVHFLYPKALGESRYYMRKKNYLKHYTVRWLIDTDKDEEGMRVLADLHGGDPKNAVALAEFKEIKERVEAEVFLPVHISKQVHLSSVIFSVLLERLGHMLSCGRNTRNVFC